MRHTITVGVVLLSACVSVTARDEPALIVDANRESHDEIVRAVSAALGVASVTIADDALTKDNVLFIERARARDLGAQQPDGRSLEKPEQFQLVKHGDECVLVHSASGARSVLHQSKCSLTAAGSPPP